MIHTIGLMCLITSAPDTPKSVAEGLFASRKKLESGHLVCVVDRLVGINKGSKIRYTIDWSPGRNRTEMVELSPDGIPIPNTRKVLCKGAAEAAFLELDERTSENGKKVALMAERKAKDIRPNAGLIDPRWLGLIPERFSNMETPNLDEFWSPTTVAQMERVAIPTGLNFQIRYTAPNGVERAYTLDPDAGRQPVEARTRRASGSSKSVYEGEVKTDLQRVTTDQWFPKKVEVRRLKNGSVEHHEVLTVEAVSFVHPSDALFSIRGVKPPKGIGIIGLESYPKYWNGERVVDPDVTGPRPNFSAEPVEIPVVVPESRSWFQIIAVASAVVAGGLWIWASARSRRAAS